MNNLNNNADTDGEDEIRTITDFDIGFGNDPSACVRVSHDTQTNVSSPEVNLIMWLLLEQSFGSLRNTEDRTESDTLAVPGNPIQRNCNEVGCDSVSSDDDKSGSPSDADVEFLDNAPALASEVEELTRNLLRCMGISVPFETLSEPDKIHLYEQFSASNDLLATAQYNSALELFEDLRLRSKFRDNFEVTRTLGRGVYGVALAVKLKSGEFLTDDRVKKTTFAIKKIILKLDRLDRLGKIKEVLNEAAVLKKLCGHPRIARFHNSWLALEYEEGCPLKDSPLVFYLQMDLYGQSLDRWKEDFISKDRRISMKLILIVLHQIMEGAEWIHSHNILHLDIKPANIFWLDAHCKDVVIGDFGLAVQSNSFEGRRGTYCAPENVLTEKSDVYSVGFTIFDLATTFRTRSERDSEFEKRRIHTGLENLDTAIKLMTARKPSDRPSASQLLQQINLS